MAKGKYQEWLTEDGLTLIKGWARDGLTKEMIAGNMHIGRQTLNEWANKYQDIADALKNNGDLADTKMVNALYQSGLGFSVKKKIVIKCKRIFYDDAGNKCSEEIPREFEVEDYIPPNIMAQAIWLNNRKPKQWRRNHNKEALDEEKFKEEKKNNDLKNF